MQHTLVNDTVCSEYEVELTDESVECGGFPLPGYADNVDRDAGADNHKTHASVCRCGIERYHQQEDDTYHEGNRDEYVELQTTSVAAVLCVDTTTSTVHMTTSTILVHRDIIFSCCFSVV